MKTQLERLEYIKNNIDLENLTNNEIELATDYILEGKGDNNKNYIKNRDLQRKMNREKINVMNGNGMLVNILEEEWMFL